MNARDYMVVAHAMSKYHVLLEKETMAKLDQVRRGNDALAKQLSLGEAITSLVNAFESIEHTTKILQTIPVTGKEKLNPQELEEFEQVSADLLDHRILNRTTYGVAKECVRYKLNLPLVVRVKKLSDNRCVKATMLEYNLLKH